MFVTRLFYLISHTPHTIHHTMGSIMSFFTKSKSESQSESQPESVNQSKLKFVNNPDPELIRAAIQHPVEGINDPDPELIRAEIQHPIEEKQESTPAFEPITVATKESLIEKYGNPTKEMNANDQFLAYSVNEDCFLVANRERFDNHVNRLEWNINDQNKVAYVRYDNNTLIRFFE